MTPYYQDDLVTIYHGNAYDFPDPDGVRLLLTDPPYGRKHRVNGHHGKVGKFQGEAVHGDDQPFDPRPWLRFGRAVIFGGNYFAHLLPPSGWIIWSKVQDNRFVRGRASQRSLAEVAWTNIHQYVTIYNCFWAGSPLHRKGEERGSQLHPTQKPVELMRWIVERYTEPGDLVYDPFMGSGPIAKACAETGRRYVGIEIDERWCENAVSRFVQKPLGLSA